MADFQYRGRGSFPSGRINKRSNRGRSYGNQHNSRSANPNLRARLDGDVQMNGVGEDFDRPTSSNHQRRFDPVGNRYKADYRNDHRSRRPQIANHAGRMLQRLGLPTVIASATQSDRTNNNDWYRITIAKGTNLSKDVILSAIRGSLSDLVFEPLNFHEAGTAAAFFVLGKKVALSIGNMSNRIPLPDGSKMIINLQRLTGRPQIVLTAEVVEKLKLCMNKRYDVPTCSLNLSDLYHDDDLSKEELCLDLCNNSVADRVLAIIAEHIPELKSLSLSKNRLTTLRQFSNLPIKAPHLACLTLADNRLRSERELQAIDKLKLEELTLDSNPLCNNFEDKQSYVRAIRKIFPKVVRLDGHTLPPPITFDADTPTSLPAAKGNYFMNEQCQNIICHFINRYFEVYDGATRQPLMDAYHPEVMFSLSTSNSRLLNRSTNWADYQSNDRNLKSLRDTQKRQAHLKRGQLDVVALLTKLPATQHSPDSFTVDVNVATPVMLTFTIYGFFKEKASKLSNKPIRRFARTFVTIPSTREYGLSIINEMFNLAVAVPAANEKYFPAVAAAATTVPLAVTNGNQQLSELQVQMVQQFSVQSGMNVDWSRRCLLENNWDYDQAAKVFVEVNAKHAIPPEAFFKS